MREEGGERRGGGCPLLFPFVSRTSPLRIINGYSLSLNPPFPPIPFQECFFFCFYYHVLLFFITLSLFLPTTFMCTRTRTRTRTHYPHPQPTTFSRYPRPATFSNTQFLQALSHFMSSDNTFPEFSLKIMFITSIRRYFNSRDGIILGYSFVPLFNVTDFVVTCCVFPFFETAE